MAGSLGKIIFLLSRMSPVIRTCAGVVAVREADPWGLILNARIPGSVAGWSKALPNSSAARSSGESGNNRTVVCPTLPSREASYDLRA